MPTQYKKDTQVINRNELEKLVLEGYAVTKVVRECSNTSGMIRVPASFIGKKVRVLLIPEDNVLDLGV